MDVIDWIVRDRKEAAVVALAVKKYKKRWLEDGGSVGMFGRQCQIQIKSNWMLLNSPPSSLPLQSDDSLLRCLCVCTFACLLATATGYAMHCAALHQPRPSKPTMRLRSDPTVDAAACVSDGGYG